MKHFLGQTIALCCALLIFIAPLCAQSARPKIGVVLKGGGALGFAHVGVLKVLERNRVPIDCVAGTSMGAIVGAAYASGATIEQMEKTLSETDWNALFGEKIERDNLDYRLKAGRAREIYGDVKVSFEDGKFNVPKGVVEGQNIRLLFQELFGYPPVPVDFDSLPVPFRAVTADVETGAAYVPGQGDLAKVVRASMSIPGAFSPIDLDGHLVVDGGITNNLPIDVARGMGCEVLIVVDLKSELAKRQDLQSPLSLSGQMISLLLMQNSTLSRRLVQAQDVVIEPDVTGFAVSDFPEALKLMSIGEESAQASVPAIRHLSIPQAEYDRYLSARTSRKGLMPEGNIDFVRLKNDSHVSDSRIQEMVTIRAGEPLDHDKIESDVQRIYQSGYFSKVEYAVVEEGGQRGVEINADGKDWLRQYFRFGFAIEDNLEGDDNFRLGLNFRSYEVFSKDSYFESQVEVGKSPRVMAELYQPLFEDSPYFINPKVSLGRTDINATRGGEVVAEYERTEGLATFAIGRRLSTLGEVTVDYTRGFGELSRDIGDPALNDFSYDIGDVSAGLEFDTQDKPDFPTSGFRFSARYIAAVDDLGAPSDFQEIKGLASMPFSFGRNTIIIRDVYNTTFGDRPLERSYSLGGFLGISGTLQNSLVASDYNSGAIVYFRRFSEVANPFFDLAFFAGGSFEMTTIHNGSQEFENYDLINSGSIFVGADTPLLPVYLSFGMADIDEQSVYLSMGRLSQSAR